MKSSSRLFPVRLHSAESRGDLLEDVYLIKPNNSPDKSVELAVTRLGATDVALRPGPPLIFFHGCYQNRQLWLGDEYTGLAGYLARNGYDVWLLDARGHGLSVVNDSFERNTLIDYARYDIPATISFVHEVSEQAPVWIGQAEGYGAVLMALACGTLEPSKLSAVLGMGEAFPSGSLRRLPLANHLAEMVRFSDITNPAFGPELEPKALRHQLWREQGVFGQRGRSLGVDLWHRLGSLSTPMALIQTAESERVEVGLQKLLNSGNVASISTELVAGGLNADAVCQTLACGDTQSQFWLPVASWMSSLEHALGFLPSEQIAPAC